MMLQRSIPGAELVVLPQSGHFPWVERVQEFAFAIKNRLKRVEN